MILLLLFSLFLFCLIIFTNDIVDKIKKKESRSLKMLYSILYHHYKKRKNVGICTAILYLSESNIISHKEFVILKNHFISQYPTSQNHPEFVKYLSGPIFDYWFTGTNSVEEFTIRENFLRKIISTS